MEIIVNSVRTIWKYNGMRTRILKAKQTEEEKKKRRNDSRFNQKTRWKDNSERNEKKNSLLLCSAWIFASANRPSKSKLHQVIIHHLLFIFWQQYVCAISIKASILGMRIRKGEIVISLCNCCLYSLSYLALDVCLMHHFLFKNWHIYPRMILIW